MVHRDDIAVCVGGWLRGYSRFVVGRRLCLWCDETHEAPTTTAFSSYLSSLRRVSSSYADWLNQVLPWFPA